MTITAPAPLPTSRSAFDNDSRAFVATDWASGRSDFTFDGTTTDHVKSFEELLTILGNVPHKILLESSFESFVPGRRFLMLALARSFGHEVYVFRPTATARYRQTHSLTSDDRIVVRTGIGTPEDTGPLPKDPDGCGALDSRVIYNIGIMERTHVYPMMYADPDWYAVHSARTDTYFLLKMTKQKPAQLIKPAKALLGWFSKLSDADKLAFGNGAANSYNESLLAAVYYTTATAWGRKEFERQLGLHGSGYPALLRSEIYHHGFGTVSKRMTIAEYRPNIRRLRAIFRAAGVSPATVTFTI